MKLLSYKTFAIIGGITASLGLSTTGQAQSTAPFSINQTRPRLVLLLHGVSPKPTESPDQFIARSGHARHYWGYDFIKGLQGKLDQTDSVVITPKIGGSLRIRQTTKADWQPTTTDSNLFDLAPIVFPYAGLNISTTYENNTQFVKEYVNFYTKPGAQSTMVMVNTRDGSKHLIPQLAETIEEVYHSYTVTYGHLPEARQPQIYMVGHSFGGVIARAILANPTGGDLWGNKLTATQRLRCDYLRKRVVLVQTLSAPHEGTFIGDPAGDVADFIAANGYAIIYSFIDTYNWATNGGLTQTQMRAKARETVKMALDAVSGKRDCLQDLQRMPEYNTGILHPSTAQRVAGGPLVPIYTSAGRSPGGTYYDQSRKVFLLGGGVYNPVSAFDLITGTRPSKEASALYLINNLLHLEGYGNDGKMPWGFAEHPAGDRTASPFAGVGPSTARQLYAAWFPNPATIRTLANTFFLGNPYRSGVADGEWDSDGFLAWDSAHAYHLNSPNIYRVFDTSLYGGMLPWDVDNHGSMMFNPGNGAWIHNELIQVAGPNVYAPGARRSGWSIYDYPVTPKTGIKVEVMQVQDAANDLDYLSGADFTLTVRLGATERTVNLAEDNSNVTSNPTFTINNYAGTIIPIRISAIERDWPDPHDQCVLSPTPGQTSMYLYFDTRTNTILGDVSGPGGQILTVKPIWWGVSNRVNTKIRITRIQ